MPVRVTAGIVINDHELNERFVLSPGPGGQNVNKTATAVQLKFHIDGSDALGEDVRERLKALAGGRVNTRGELVIFAHRHRSRERNRKDARDRLADLVRRAAVKPKRRRKTKPSRAAKQARLDAKRKRSRTKQLRRRPDD